jgi:hypothetical protein
MTLAEARAKASDKAKHTYKTGINYDCHLQSSKYFYSTSHMFHRKVLQLSGHYDNAYKDFTDNDIVFNIDKCDITYMFYI